MFKIQNSINAYPEDESNVYTGDCDNCIVGNDKTDFSRIKPSIRGSET